MADTISNSDWTRDEHVLALDLYLRRRRSPPDDTDPEVVSLSRELKALGTRLGLT